MVKLALVVHNNGQPNLMCRRSGMGTIQSTLYAMVYEKKRKFDSSENPINCLHVLSVIMTVDFEKAQTAPYFCGVLW